MNSRKQVAALALLLLMGMPVPASASLAPGAPPTRSSTVTLITGDRVTVTPVGKSTAVRVDPAPGRERMVFHRRMTAGRATVIPDDALPALSTRQLDENLFDVSGLIAQGYDDTRRSDLPVLVSGKPIGLQVTKSLPKAGITAARVSKKDKFWPVPAGQKVWLDGIVHASLDRSVPMIGAPQAWQAGLRGTGVRVAVLDTGYDATHPDLAGVAEAKGFTDAGEADVTDRVGHGTHVASTIAGRGGTYTGVAPDAGLLVGKVLGDNGSAPASWILAGMEWAANSGARVVNMSLGSYSASDGTDALSQAVNELTAKTGTLFVAAAGNSGRDRSVGAPAAADAALAVGSVTKDGLLSDFSSRGPRIGDEGIKPEITAPGTAITAARAKDTAGEGLYKTFSGTSMATPHVAGAAALLAQRHPDWKAAELKAALVANAKPVTGQTIYAQGGGIVDIPAALSAKVSTANPAVSFGLIPWPPASQPVQRKSIVYRNDGDGPVTIALTGPAGLFTVEPASLTAPAHGTAEATVILTPAAGTPGLSGAKVTSTVDGQPGPSVLVGASLDTEQYSLHIKALRRDGTPATLPNLIVANQDASFLDWPVLGPDGVTLRVPKGTFTVLGSIVERDENFVPHAAINVAREFTVDKDTDLVLETRAAQPVKVEVDSEPDARQLQRGDGIGISFGDGGSIGTEMDGPPDLPFYVQPGPVSPQVAYYTHSTWARPLAMMQATAPEQFEPPVQYAINSLPITRDITAAVADAKTGRPEDIAGLDLRGKIALLRQIDDLELAAQVANVAAAGAVAVLYPPQRFGVYFPEKTPIPVLDTGLAFDRLAAGGFTARLRGFDVSPFAYHLMFTERGSLPAGKTYRARKQDMATVDTTYNSPGAPGIGNGIALPAPPFSGFVTIQRVPTKVPMRRVEYHTPGEWQHWATVGEGDGGIQQDAPTTYERGRAYHSVWHRGVFAPRLDPQYPGYPPVRREGDAISVYLPMFSGPNRWGQTARDNGTDTGSTTLSLAGKVLAQYPWPGAGNWSGLPAGPGDYELNVVAQRSAPEWGVSTEIRSTWRFQSQAGKTPSLPDIGYDVPLDENNAAPAKAIFKLTAKAKSLKVTGSLDDGRTWTDLRVVQVGDCWMVQAPDGKPGQFVSLRVVADAVDQTVIRAYRTR